MSNIVDLPRKNKRKNKLSPFEQNMAALIAQIVVIKDKARIILEEADEIVPTIRKVIAANKNEDKK